MARAKLIGRIILENSDGSVMGTCDLNLPIGMRPRVMFTELGVFEQNRQTADDQWVYRYFESLNGRPANRFLTDYRNSASANWDGPALPIAPTTWNEIAQRFRKLFSSKYKAIPIADVKTLFEDADVVVTRLLHELQSTQGQVNGRF